MGRIRKLAAPNLVLVLLGASLPNLQLLESAKN